MVYCAPLNLLHTDVRDIVSVSNISPRRGTRDTVPALESRKGDVQEIDSGTLHPEKYGDDQRAHYTLTTLFF